MAEQLGEAVLVLRTDDRGLDTGIASAKGKSEQLGRSLDATSGSATKLSRTLDDAGRAASTTGAKTGEYSREILKLKAAVDPAWAALEQFKSQAQLARQAMQDGVITGKQYVDFMRQSGTAAGILTTAQAKVTGASAAQKAGLTNLTRQLSDISTMYSMGAKPAMIFSSQIGQVMDAIQQASGGTSKFATFMSGPWGMAITAATVVLGPLIAKMFESNDAAKKAADAHETWADKLDRARHSQEEVTRALREYNAEQRKAKETTLEAATAASLASVRAIEAKKKEQEQIKKDLADARFIADNSFDPDIKANAVARVSDIQQKLAANRKELARLGGDARAAAINTVGELAKQDADPVEQIKTKFDAKRKAAEAAGLSVDQLRKKLADLYRQEKTETEAAQKAERSTSANLNRQSGREIDLAEAMSIAKGAGFTVTSSQRSYASQKALYDAWVAQGMPADNPVAKPGNSAHERGAGLDIAFGKGIDIAAIRKAFSDQGVALTKVLTERGHYHIEFATGGADRAASDAARDQQKQAQVQERYDRDLASLTQEAIRLRQQMAITLEERFRIEQEALNLAMAEQRRRIEENNDYSPAQKKTLLAQLDIKEALERQALQHRKMEEVAKQNLEVAQALGADQIEQLQRQLQVTDIRTKRLEIERQILDLTYQQRQRALEATLSSSTASDSQKITARRELADLPAAKAADSQQLERQYQSPIRRYMSDLKAVGGSINDSLGNVAVSGLQTLNDRLVDVIMRTKSLGGAFRDVASLIISELARIAIQRTLISPLADMLFGKAGGGGGLFSVIGSALGKLWGGAHADGGLIPNGTIGIVGERGPEPVIATSAGAMVRTTTTLGARDQGRGTLQVVVSGARGNAEIETMVRSGVRQGLAAYDQVVGERVKDNLARRG